LYRSKRSRTHRLSRRGARSSFTCSCFTCSLFSGVVVVVVCRRCYKTRVRQFHVHVEQMDASKIPHQVQIVDFTNLGTFDRRRIEVIDNRKEANAGGDGDGGSSSSSSDLPPNPLAGNFAEIARILDVHTAGDVCDATGEPRSTLVQLLCCSPEVMDGARQFPVPPEHAGDPATGGSVPPVALYGVYEDPDKLCNYVVTICTSLLCDGPAASPVKNTRKKTKGQSNGVGGGKKRSSSSTTSSRRSKASKVPRENESIREILDRTLGGRCLDALTDGWWSYSYCVRAYRACSCLWDIGLRGLAVPFCSPLRSDFCFAP
jgi:hypothetical protein